MTTPSDPVCPACGEAVGSTSTYCMHCDAEFDAPIDSTEFTRGDSESRQAGDWGDGTEPEPASDWGDSDQAVTEHPSGWDDGGPGDHGHTEGWAAETDATASTTPSSAADDASPATDDGSLGRNVLQSLARIGAVLLTVVAGLLTTAALMIVTVEVVELWLPIVLVALVGIVTGGIVIARQDTGIDALADALYVTAAVVVGVPFLFALLLPTGDPIGERIAVGLVFSFFGAFVGVPAFVIGWWLQPDDE